MNQNLIKPPSLRRGDVIGLVSPSYAVEPRQWRLAVDLFRARGWQVALGETLSLSSRRFAGADDERAADLIEMLSRRDVAAVVCARGGYGSARLLPELLQHTQTLPPKWIIGYSDITALLTCWTQNLHYQCIHGPMPVDITNNNGAVSQGWAHLFDLLEGKMPEYRTKSHHLNHSGRVVAPITGGNLSVIHSLNGTPYQCNTEDHILLIEDVGESLHHLDRMLNSMRLSGQLAAAAGLLVGSFIEMRDTEPTYGQTAAEIISEYVEHYDYPVAFDFPVGHGVVNEPVVLGAEVVMDVTDDGCTVKYSE